MMWNTKFYWHLVNFYMGRSSPLSIFISIFSFVVQIPSTPSTLFSIYIEIVLIDIGMIKGRKRGRD